MEKSLLNAAVTSTTAARKTAPKLAIPARRALSVNRSAPTRLPTSAANPARNEYPASANARSKRKLPREAMTLTSSFQNWRAEATRVGKTLPLFRQHTPHLLDQNLGRARLVEKGYVEA